MCCWPVRWPCGSCLELAWPKQVHGSWVKGNTLIDQILQLDDGIRYVAVYRNGQLETRSKSQLQGASSGESDRYEELLVNPTLLTLTTQRGNVDCGGLEFVLIRYGNFFQFVLPMQWGHVSVCIDAAADPLLVGASVQEFLRRSPESE